MTQILPGVYPRVVIEAATCPTCGASPNFHLLCGGRVIQDASLPAEVPVALARSLIDCRQCGAQVALALSPVIQEAAS